MESPPAKLFAQGHDLLPEACGPLLGGLQAALELGVLPGQPAVAELQVLQAAQQVSSGGPGVREGLITGHSSHPLPFPGGGSGGGGNEALLENEEQERDCPALQGLAAQLLPQPVPHSL